MYLESGEIEQLFLSEKPIEHLSTLESFTIPRTHNLVILTGYEPGAQTSFTNQAIKGEISAGESR